MQYRVYKIIVTLQEIKTINTSQLYLTIHKTLHLLINCHMFRARSIQMNVHLPVRREKHSRVLNTPTLHILHTDRHTYNS